MNERQPQKLTVLLGGNDAMKLLLIFGNSAVGKMTVGQEICKFTDLQLFHNHVAIEPVIEVFGYRNAKAVNRIREVYFEEFAASEAYGLIFTYMFGFDMPSEWEYIGNLCKLFKQYGAQIYCAELVAPQEIRLQRNSTENRLLHKPSKRELETSRQRLLRDDENHRIVSFDNELPGALPFDDYIKIDNSELPPNVAAMVIKDRFSL